MDFKTNKVAFISDIHLGVHQNSSVWHTIALDFVRWLDITLKEKGIKDLIIAGDIFHNRHEIGVNTIHCAHEFFKVLGDYNIYAICGNHDAYYKDKSDVNSISILDGYKNIAVFHELTTLVHNNKTFTYCPWGTDTNQIPKTDVVVGHFEIQNFRINASRVCEDGTPSKTLLEKTDLVITGHFHCRECREYPGKQTILYLGSPYELDFGDREQEKGITILDTDNMSLEFVKNNITPKHKKIKLSDLLDKKITANELTIELPNNFISLVVDQKINEQALGIILTKLSQYKPRHVRTDFNIFEVVSLSATELNEVSIDIDTALHEFINLIDTPVSKKDILDKCLELYRTSQTTNG